MEPISARLRQLSEAAHHLASDIERLNKSLSNAALHRRQADLSRKAGVREAARDEARAKLEWHESELNRECLADRLRRITALWVEIEGGMRMDPLLSISP